MCRSADDLQFKSQVDNPPAGLVEDLAPPQQIFDITGAGADARRERVALDRGAQRRGPLHVRVGLLARGRARIGTASRVAVWVPLCTRSGKSRLASIYTH